MSNNIKFNIEQPSNEDLFTGNGHLASALAIKQTLEQQSEIKILGLEGELGAGKSSIIKMLESKLDSSYKFIYFDISTYYHNSFKSEFIKHFSNSLINSFNENINSNNIELATNKALGKTFVYKKETQSNISWLVFIFAISIIFSVRYFNDALNIFISTIGSWFGNKPYTPSFDATVTCLLGLSPLITIAANSLCNVIRKNKTRKINSIGDLLKRNSADTITETLMVNKDVGGFELKEAFEEMLKEIPTNNVIVLILDNIDRIEKDKLGEIWSDIDIFSNVNSKNLKIILPFSERHVSKALNKEDATEGREYISKKLPVVFKAPPVVTANWRELFNSIWNDSIQNYDGLEQSKNLISTWMKSGHQITPRFIKRHINDIASILSCNTSISNAAICSAYVLACRNNGIDISTLLSDVTKIDDHEDLPWKEYVKQIVNTHKILDSINNRKSWTTEIACIHYQTTSDIARSELLDEPIRNGFSKNSPREVISLSNVYGYDIVLDKITSDIGYIECIKFCAIALDEGDETGSNNDWLEKWIPKFSSMPDSTAPLVQFDEPYIQSIIRLQESNFIPTLDNIRLYKSKIEQQKSQPTNDDFSELYLCFLALKKTDEIPNLVQNPTSESLLLLWEHREDYIDWNITDLDIKEGTAIECIEQLISNENLDYSFIRWSIRFIRLDRDKIYTYINNSERILIPVSQNRTNADALMCLPFTHEWYTDDFLPLLIDSYNSFISLDKKAINTEEKEELNSVWMAIIMAQITTSEKYDSTFIISNNGTSTNYSVGSLLEMLAAKVTTKKYEQYLSELLVLSPRMSSLYKSLTSAVGNYYKASIRELITRFKFNALDIKQTIHEHYESYRSLLTDAEASHFISELYRWNIHYKQVDISLWTTDFISDALTYSKSQWGQIFESNFISKSNSIDYWLDAFENEKSYFSEYICWLSDNKTQAPNQDDIVAAMKAMFENISTANTYKSMQTELIEKTVLLLDPKHRSALKRYFSNRVMLVSTNQEEKIAIIATYGSLFSLSVTNDSSVHESYILLIESTTDEGVLQWLSRQDFKINQWSFKNITELESALSTPPYIDIFASLLKKIKVRLAKIKKETQIDEVK